MNKKERALIARLDEVALGSLDKASFKAVLRLQVFFTGRTHELFLRFGKEARGMLLGEADKDGLVDVVGAFRLQSELLMMWGDTFKTWQDEFLQARYEAVSLPYGVLAVRDERLVRAAVSDERLAVSEGLIAKSQELIAESIEDGVFKPQIEVLLNAAAEHLYGDGLNLSARLWRIEGAGRDAINSVIIDGITNGDSAWMMAKKLEEFLGAGADCPRWTSTRLYGRTASDKAAGDVTGLLSGNDCDGRGISYNALRLARTEIQKAHALATDKVLAAQPWVEKEQCHLSASHPEADECDDVIANGEEGKGIYEVGTIEYPLHPHCFCYKTAVLMDATDFANRINGWVSGSESWAEMDEYKAMIGGDTGVSLMPNALSLAVWLFGEELGLAG